jgi:eukaryotic-like serine/threonine-protein kinase
MLHSASSRPRARHRGSNLTEFREFQDGEVIPGTRYRVLSLIGVGGMGSVYEVDHTELGKRFVLKALLRELSRRDDLVQRLRNEWRALARLNHANIVTVTDAGTSTTGVPFYVMERLDGDTLAEFLRQKRRLPVSEAVNIAACVLEALSAAHDIGIIHRDVKPANVFIASGGGIKLLDFGIAKIADSSGVITARGLAVGTPRYMSPEQARGDSVDGRSDIYASALILFEMIAGVGPFDDARDSNELLLAHLARETPLLSSMVGGVPPELDQILLNMLAKDCRQRPAHAREAAERLRNFAFRQRSGPATDAPTVEASYAAATVNSAEPRPRVPSPVHQAVTRAEGAARSSPPSAESPSDDALTLQRSSSPPGTTQVTLSVTTGAAFSVSAVPNTTFVSAAPALDGSTTMPMPTAAKRSAFPLPEPSQSRASGPERTEMLGEFSLPAPVEPPATRTRVPLPDRARPVSITPPPVVDTVRVEKSAARAARFGRWAGLSAAALGFLLVTGFVLRRAATPSEDRAVVAAPRPTAVNRPVRDPARPPTGVEKLGEFAAAAAVAAAPSASASASAAEARFTGAPAGTGSARNSRMMFDAKRLRSPALSTRSLDPGAAARNLSARASGGAPALPGSGL